MTLLHRRILYIIFILLFFIITPAVLFYAAGYNFDVKNGAIERTGILIIKTDPRGAQVHLGDKKKYNWLYTFFYGDKPLLTPLKLRNLLPDDYALVITKDGYFDYHKKITLYPGQTVVLDEVTLLKQSVPEQIVSENVIKTALAPDKNKLAVVTDTSLIVVEANTGRLNPLPLSIAATTADNFDIVWEQNNRKILLTLPNWPVYNLETGQKEIDIGRYFPIAGARARWSAASDDKIFLLRNNTVYSFSVAEKKYTALFSTAGLHDFLVKDGNLYTLETRVNGSVVAIYDVNSLQAQKTISLPDARSYEFKNTREKLLYVYEPMRALLYVIDPFSFAPLQSSLSDVRNFSVRDTAILYWNDFEIWSYDIVNKTNGLLTRISKPIETALLGDQYVVYTTPTTITGMERGDRDFVNVIDILKWQDTSDALASLNGKYLYFVSPLNERRILWRLDIK